MALDDTGTPDAKAAPDLRLAFVAAGGWAAAIAVLYLGAGWGVGITVVGVGGVVAGLRGRRAWAGVLAAMAIGVTAGAMAASAQVALRDGQPLHDWVEQRRVVTVRVTVADDALRLRGGQRETFRIPVRIERVREGDRRVDVSTRAVVFATDAGRWRWEKALPGQELTLRGKLSAGEPGTLSAADIAVGEPPTPHGQPPWWQRAAGYLRAGLRQACAGLPSQPGGLLPGLALGDVTMMDAGVDGDFRDAGMTHLLAVSGSNVAIVVGAAVLVAVGCGAGRRARVVIGIAVIVGFVVLVRPSPSVLRAAVMGGLGLLVVSRRGGRDAVPVLAAAITVLLLIDPGLATNLGFVLSVVATAGLVFFATRWTAALRDRGWPQWLAAAVAIPAAAQLAVTPVLAAATGAITPVAVVANALAAVAVPPATVLAVAATVLWPLWPDAATALTWLASWPAQWLVAVAAHAARVPSGSVPWPEGVVPGLLLALLIVACLVLARWRAGRRLLLVVVLGIVVGVAPVRLLTGGWPPAGWVLIACDVGQGDALILPTGVASRVIVVDTGPDPRAIDTCLRSLDVERVALLVFSHIHADHIGGVTGVYRGRTVEAVLPPLFDDHAPSATAGRPRGDTGADAGSGGSPGRATVPHGPGADRFGSPDLPVTADRLCTNAGADAGSGGLPGRATVPHGPGVDRFDSSGDRPATSGGGAVPAGPGAGSVTTRDAGTLRDLGGPGGVPPPTRERGRLRWADAKHPSEVAHHIANEPDAPHGWEGSARQRLTEAIRDTPALDVDVGDRVDVGHTHLEVLAPDTGFAGTRSDSNNNSYVLRATVAGTSILLSGDIEEPAQAAVLASGQRLRADVLKVPHHGSGYFDATFFEAVKPRLAVISSGRGNDYGHPHRRTLRQLRRQQAAVFRTDRRGSFAVIAEAGRLAVMTMD